MWMCIGRTGDRGSRVEDCSREGIGDGIGAGGRRRYDRDVLKVVLQESTVANTPNANERIESLLPLIPGVVRGPDGLINMKGARTSQGGMLVNSANVSDPVTGNTGMNLPIDVVSSAQVVARSI